MSRPSAISKLLQISNFKSLSVSSLASQRSRLKAKFSDRLKI